MSRVVNCCHVLRGLCHVKMCAVARPEDNLQPPENLISFTCWAQICISHQRRRQTYPAGARSPVRSRGSQLPSRDVFCYMLSASLQQPWSPKWGGKEADPTITVCWVTYIYIYIHIYAYYSARVYRRFGFDVPFSVWP